VIDCDYGAVPDLNDRLMPAQREQIEQSLRVGHDEIPLALDDNGDLVQMDKGMRDDPNAHGD
jgi:hypothetical protein